MEIKVGTIKTATKVVAPEDSAIKVGSGLVDVFATPALIALCEKTASEAIASFLEPGYVTVGTNVNINHVAASKIGATVQATAKVIGAEGRIINFEINVYEGQKLIANGTHQRCVVNKERFIAKLN